MSRNLFTSALLGGLSGYAAGRAQEIQAQEEFQRRLALQENAQENLMERMGARGGVVGAGSPSSGRSAKIDPVFDEGEAQRRVNFAGGDITDAQLRATMTNVPERMAPGYTQAPVLDPRDAQAGVVYGPNGERLREGETPYMEIDRSSPLVQRKIEELARLRKMAAGFEAKDYQTYQETDLIDKASKGDRGAAEGVLLGKGKDPLETAARAEAQEAKADKDKRTDPNARRGSGSGGGGGKPPSVRSTKVDERGNVIAIMSDGSTKDLGIKSDAFNARVAKVISDMEKGDHKFAKLPDGEKRQRAIERLGAGSASPAQSPAAPASAATRKPLTAFVKPNP